ncbi:MAG: VCBS repeat-containing protein [Planctomycetes bacterium]|nr:VCBS repeat-containing protein [Planctomycetota bacterium]
MLRRTILIIFTTAVLASSASAQFEFPQDYEFGSSVRAMARGDFNNDGKVDIVLTRAGSTAISVLQSDGSGRFSIVLSYFLGYTTGDVAVADMNSDGKADVIVALPNTINVDVLLGNGDATFQLAIFAAVGVDPFALAVADFGHDGKPDLAAADYNGNVVAVAKGNGAGSFVSLATFPIGGNPDALATGDFDHDGNIDIMVASKNGPVAVLVGSPNGAFYGPGYFPVLGPAPVSLVTGGFLKNGNLDAAVCDGPTEMDILIGNGTGGFASPYGYTTDFGPASAAVADINSDGFDDLAVCNQIGNSISPFYGNGLGTFDSIVTIPLGGAPGPVSIVLDDFRIDGKPDAATANQSGSVSILLNDCTDIGGGSFGAIQVYSTNVPNTNPLMGVYGYATGDINNDGSLDILIMGMDGGYTLHTRVLFGAPDGSYNSVIEVFYAFASGFVSAPTLLDVDSDGKLDFLYIIDLDLYVSRGDATGYFSQAATYNINNFAAAIAGVDADRDGNIDLVVASTTAPLKVMRNTGSGIYGPAVVIAGSSAADDIKIGDLNHDGIDDVVAVSRQTGDVTQLLGDGVGSFNYFGFYSFNTPNLAAPPFVALADFNRDGNADYAVSGYIGLHAYFGDGSGNALFIYSTTPPDVQYANSVDTADMNDDGKPDLVMSFTNMSYQRNAILYYSSGYLGFEPSSNTTPVSFGDPIAARRVNSDAKPDLIVVASNGTLTIRLADATQNNFELFKIVETYPQTDNTYKPVSIATGDLDQNGYPDFATANIQNSTISIGLGVAPGCILPRDNYSAPSQPIAIALGDFNMDGVLDVATACRAAKKIAIRKGDQTGALGAETTFASGGTPIAIAVGNLNSNGTPDLAVVNISPSKISLFESNGTANFTSIINLTTSAPTPIFVAIGELNGDGNMDISAAISSPGAVDVFLSNGGGSFSGVATYSINAGSNTSCVAAGDLGSNGSLDLAVTNYALNDIAYTLNQGAGTFGAYTFAAAGNNPFSVVVGNLDGDGFDDAAAANNGGVDITIFLGLGSPAEQPPQSIVAGPGPRSLVIADINLDAKPDLIAASSSTLVVLQNTEITPGGIRSFESAFGISNIGFGTQGCSGRIAIGANKMPRINTSDFAITFTHAPHSTLGLGYFGQEPDVPGGDPFFLGVSMNINLLSTWSPPGFFDIYTDAAGMGLGPVAIPNDNSLIGVYVYVQGLFVEDQPSGWGCTPTILHAVTSEAIKLVIQP